MPATILVVEDEPAIQELISATLQHAGHRVMRAYSAEEAVPLVNGTLPDVVLLDWMLPGMNGIQFARRLRGEDRTRELPIIMLTARGEEQDKVAGLDAGADDYLVKPITIDELAARVRALVRRTAGHAQSVWQHGALEYDPASKVVRWRGEPIELTGRELALLEAFLTESRRVLSKAYLLEKLYDWSGAEPEGNSLEVHIHHLRRKIDPAIVRTVRGVGYALGSDEAVR